VDDVTSVIGATSLPQNIKDKLAQHFENSNIVDGYTVSEEISKAKQGRSEILSPTENLLARGVGSLRSTGINQLRSSSVNNYLKFNSIRFKIGPEVRTSSPGTMANASRLYIDIRNWYNAAK